MFNLIPSCLLCNQRFKGDKDFQLHTHVHPFLHSFDDLFRFELTVPYLPSFVLEDFEIKVVNKGTFPRNSIQDFEIMSRYDTAMETVFDMLNALYKKPASNLGQVSDLVSFEDEWDRLLRVAKIPKISDDICLYSLGKLKRDICLDQNIPIS